MSKFGILFDLDGVLLDTAPDLAAALNQLLIEEKKATLPFEKIRNHCSYGVKRLLGIGFEILSSHSDFERLKKRYLEIYQTSLNKETRIFDGIPQILTTLREKKIPFGIVTNKIEKFAHPLIEHFFAPFPPSALVCGDTLPFCKPSKEPLLHACKQLSLAPENCFFIGDSEFDAQAANAANIPFVLAKYGYIHEDDKIEQWNAVQMIAHPKELLSLIFPPY